MGYQHLYFVRQDPNFVPEDDRKDKALNILDEWRADSTFSYDGPADWSTAKNQKLHGSFPDELVCPKCNARLDIGGTVEELDEWQHESQSEFYSSENQKAYVFQMPCCSAQVVAAHLALDSPSRWSKAYCSRFVIRLREFSQMPGDVGVTSSHVEIVEEALGCPVFHFFESGT